MNLVTALTIIYIIILVTVCLRILFETRDTNKTMAYLLFCIFIPVAGILFYLIFGINYWKNKQYYKKTGQDAKLLQQLKKDIAHYSEVALKSSNEALNQNAELASMLIKDLNSPLTGNNQVKLLVNGEQKFPELLTALRVARHHIHLEYYIFEYDSIGTEIIELLIQKAKEGVKVRLIYDDFGSPTIKKKTEQRMREAGVEVNPFHKVHFYLLANRINYRNHRKIVVIDGRTAFVGGINVSDRYINNDKTTLYWRDTHLRIDGPAVYYLQYLFITDWNFCCPFTLSPDEFYFPRYPADKNKGSYIQISAGGPDSILPSILFSLLQAIYLAREEILVTTPYFIPGDSIIDALCVAALSGLSVKLLVPGVSDSRLVNAASRSYYTNLLQAGVDIYLYNRGFVHAKTIVTDGMLSMVGSANMDHRSFELNFEANTFVYDRAIANQLRTQFFEDLKYADKIDRDSWLSRPAYRQIAEKLARLFSPVL